MATILLRSRIFSVTSKFNRRFLSTGVASNLNKQATISSQSIVGEQSVASAVAAEQPLVGAATGTKKNGLIFLKHGVIASLIGTTALAGYTTYAYTFDEVEQKTKSLRDSITYTASEDASIVEKYQGLLYSAVVTVPAKAIELYLDLRRLTEEHVKDFTEPTSDKLLPDLHPSEQHVFTLVLDLNETIVYSDWKRERGWRTFKRPGIDDFLQHLAKFYEIIIYSDQLNEYVEPVVERLDPNHYIRYRLSRAATKYQDGKHYRDFSKLNRDPGKILYVSGNAYKSSLQQENCVPIKPFKLDERGDAPLDTALLDLIPFLEYVARASPADVRPVLASFDRQDIAKEFIERSKEYQRRREEQKQLGRFWRK